MQEAGTVFHMARSGRMIIKARAQVKDGAVLLDENGRLAGKVMETIGSVTTPFLSVQPMTDRVGGMIGTRLFVSEATPRRDQKSKFNKRFKSNKSGSHSKFQKRRGQRGSHFGESEKA